jgi:hypothetical protein
METSGSRTAIRIILATVATAFGLAFFAGPASAEETVWLCKPGEADNPCLGKMDGVSTAPGFIDTELGYAAAKNPPVDCFYLYPTQSEQTTSNANLDKDQLLRDVAVNQARQFSRICDVYAPMYRQHTYVGPFTDEVRDVAYNSALGAWNDYMDNHNDGRGVVIIGHSQGSMHMARLIAEEIDPNPSVRKRLISAIIPGANVYVPKGGVVGGQFQNIPACEAGDQVGCVIAYSMFTQQPNTNSSYGWVDAGYWLGPAPRPDKDLYQVMCVNPGELAGGNGNLTPLANLSVFVGQPEPAKPWQSFPDFYRGECRTAENETKGTVSWLNVEDIREPGDARPNLATLVQSSGGNLHTGDVNLALDSLVTVAASQSQAYVAAERAKVVKKRSALRKQLKSAKKKSKKLKSKARKARKLCAKKGKACSKAKRLARQSRKADRKVASLKKRDRALTSQIKSLVGPEA